MNRSTIEQTFQRELTTAINNENDLIFITYSCLENTEEKMKFALARILEKHQREEIYTPIFSCIKELIANATKANAKNILLDEGKIKDPSNWTEVVEKIRSVLNEESLLEYGIKSKKKRLSTRTYLKVRGRYLIVEVINNVPLADKELNRIREKIENSSRYDNIAEYFMENPDPEAEGMGLGLSMVVVLLKNINIPYKNFVVSTDGREKTFAKILVPLF